MFAVYWLVRWPLGKMIPMLGNIKKEENII